MMAILEILLLDNVLMFIGIFILSLFVQEIIGYFRSSLLRAFIYCMSFLGVSIHEFSHYIISLLVGVIPKNISIAYDHGYVSFKRDQRITFFQMFLISFAPLYITSYLIYLSLKILFSISLEPLMAFFLVYLIISLFIGAAPSGADIKNVFLTLGENGAYTLYQFFLVIVSFFITNTIYTTYLVNYLVNQSFEEWVLSIMIFGCLFLFYYVVKYSICLIRFLLKRLILLISRI
ncbi:MAG: hypothetical protein ACTSXH_19010 [Promethearchaeota archaeon]